MPPDTTPHYSEHALVNACFALVNDTPAPHGSSAEIHRHAQMVLDAAHDPNLGPHRSVNAQTHRAQVLAEVSRYLEYRAIGAERNGDTNHAEHIRIVDAMITLAFDGPCGRLLIGQGSDTSDPLCTLPSGHSGRCRP